MKTITGIDIELAPPIRDFDPAKHISQMFGVNAAVYQKDFGIFAHNALDIVIPEDKDDGFGRDILAMHDGSVVAQSWENPQHTKGNGIYIMSNDGKFSTNYWHLASIIPNIGEKVKKGQVIGTMGNTGLVSPKPTKMCPRCGTHLHAGLLLYGSGTEYKDFIDPLPFLVKAGDRLPVLFSRNLFVGKEGDDVSWLQTILKIEGFAEDYEPIGYFGRKTARDVIRLQQKYSITPMLGYFGPKSRDFVNRKWSRNYA